VVKITDKSDLRLVTLAEAVNVGRVSVVRLQGNVYLVVDKGMSQHTGFRVTPGFIPLINVKSRTIRAVRGSDMVEPLEAEMILTPWTGEIEHE
jgi:hypothetical protein